MSGYETLRNTASSWLEQAAENATANDVTGPVLLPVDLEQVAEEGSGYLDLLGEAWGTATDDLAERAAPWLPGESKAPVAPNTHVKNAAPAMPKTAAAYFGVTDPSAAVNGEGPVTSLRGGLTTGGVVAGRTQEERVDGVLHKSGVTVDPTELAFGASLGRVEANGDANGINLGIDLYEGGVDAVSVGANANLEGVIGVSGGAGFANRVSAPQPLADGTFQVTWENGKAVGMGLQVAEGGIGVDSGAASLLTRTFHSEAEALAFQKELQQGGNGELSVEDVQSMEPGETFDLAQTHDASGHVTPVSIAGVSLGGTFATTSGMEVEKLEGTSVRATQSSGWNLSGNVGVEIPWLGWVGSRGVGSTSSTEVDFDLSQPGAAEAFEAYQATGQLPEELPAGVTVVDAADTSFDFWSNKSQLGTEVITESGRRETGTEGLGDDAVRVDSGLRTESRDRKEFWGGTEAIDAQAHALRMTTDDEGTQLQATSRYSGEWAKAEVADDMDGYRDFQETQAMFGNEGGTYEVTTKFDAGTDEQLAERARQALETPGSEGALNPRDQEQVAGFWDLVDGMGGDAFDPGALATYFAEQGGSAADFLRSNVEGESTYIDDGTERFQGVEGHQAVEAQLAELDAAEAAGTLDPDVADALRDDLNLRILDLANCDERQAAAAELEHLRVQRDRAAALADAQFGRTSNP